MTRRLVVIGGDAAGMSAAHQALRSAKRHGHELAVTVLEATGHTSYSACGIPYWVGGEVATGDDLVARTPAEHRAMGVDLRLGARVDGVDPATRTVHYVADGAEHELAWDDLLIATGGRAITPAWAHADSGGLKRGIGALKTLDDGAAWLERLGDVPRHVVVAGAGYIGLEMAEALIGRGHRVTLLVRSRVMSFLSAPMSQRIETALVAGGVALLPGAAVVGTRHAADGALQTVETTEGDVEADLLLVALGIEPATGFLAGTGLEMTPRGALRPDPAGRVAPGIWAAGDCCEVRHRVTGQWRYLPLGTSANKAGRAVGENIGGGDQPFPGVLGSAITRFAAGPSYLEIACTGVRADEARDHGFDAVEVTTTGTTASGYHPEAAPIVISLVADRTTGRLLGAEIVGGRGAGKRIDTVAMAIWAEQSVHDLAWADLSYAPPFATAWEIVSLAARRLAERL